MKIIFYRNIEENPGEPLNNDILVRYETEFELTENVTIKDLIFYVINEFCYKCNYNDVCCEMVDFFQKEYKLRFSMSNKRLNDRVKDVFKYRIDKGKPIILIDCPDYSGAGCWGESTGLRYYIYSNEVAHQYEPHVHVKTFSNECIDRFDIIKLKLMETNNNSKPLSNKLRKEAISFIKERQIDFLEIWNEYTNCNYIIDIENFKNTGEVRYMKR